MSNYPPGVTGNEPQIAGYPETTMYVEHGHPENQAGQIPADRCVVIVLDSKAKADELRTSMARGSAVVVEPWRLLDFAAVQDEVECSYEGLADVQIVDGEAVCDCPLCETEIRIELPIWGDD